ncbi:MAG: mechanosensitive ion channel [Eubacteriales bacterium]|nr:mechanosensitive ion channel [Eubacteriales bacterium]
MNKKRVTKAIVCLILAVLFFGLGSITKAWEIVDFSNFSLSLAKVIKCLVIAFAVLFAENLIIVILDLFKTEDHRKKTVLSLVKNLMRYIAVIAIICGIIATLFESAGSVFAGLGILALIIGFGAESLISDVVTGAFILVDNQFNVGDIIEVGGFRGTVTEIGIRTTSISDPGGNIKIINHSDMKNVLNRSDNNSKAVCSFPIPYETDLEALEKKLPAMLEEIYEERKDKMKAAPIYLGVDELGGSAVVLKFVAEVNEADIYSVGRMLNRDLFLKMRAIGVECPFTQMDIHQK